MLTNRIIHFRNYSIYWAVYSLSTRWKTGIDIEYIFCSNLNYVFACFKLAYGCILSWIINCFIMCKSMVSQRTSLSNYRPPHWKEPRVLGLPYWDLNRVTDLLLLRSIVICWLFVYVVKCTAVQLILVNNRTLLPSKKEGNLTISPPLSIIFAQLHLCSQFCYIPIMMVLFLLQFRGGGVEDFHMDCGLGF